jgi:hypothetical protein
VNAKSVDCRALRSRVKMRASCESMSGVTLIGTLARA